MASSSTDLAEGDRKKFKPLRAFKKMFRDGKKTAKLSKSRGNLTDLSDDEGAPGGYRVKASYTASNLDRRISLSHDSIFTPEVAKLSSDFFRNNPKHADAEPRVSEVRPTSEEKPPRAVSPFEMEVEQRESSKDDVKEKASAIAQQLTMILNRGLEPKTNSASVKDATKEAETEPSEESNSNAIEVTPPPDDDPQSLPDDMDTAVSGVSQQAFLNNSAAYDKIAARPKNRKTNRRSRGQKRPASAIVESSDASNFWDDGVDLFNKSSHSFKEPRSESTSKTEKVFEPPKEEEKPEEKPVTVKKTSSFKGPSVMSPLADIKSVKLRKTPTEEKKEFTTASSSTPDNKDNLSPKPGPTPKPRWNKATKTTSSPVERDTKTPDKGAGKFSPPKLRKHKESLDQTPESVGQKKHGFKPSWLNLTPNKADEPDEKNSKEDKSPKQWSPTGSKKADAKKEEKPGNTSSNEEVNYLAVLERKKSAKKDSFKKERSNSSVVAKAEESTESEKCGEASPVVAKAEESTESEKCGEDKMEDVQQNPFAKLKKVKKEPNASSPISTLESPSLKVNSSDDDKKPASPSSKIAFFKSKMEEDKADKSSVCKQVQRKHSGRQSFPPKPVIVENESPLDAPPAEIVGGGKKDAAGTDVKSPLLISTSNSSVKVADNTKGHDTEASSIFPVKLRKTPKSDGLETKDSETNDENTNQSKISPASKKPALHDKPKEKFKLPAKADASEKIDSKKDINSNTLPREEVDKNETKKSLKNLTTNSKNPWQSNAKHGFVSSQKQKEPIPNNKDDNSKDTTEKIVPKWKIPTKPQSDKPTTLSNGQKIEKQNPSLKSPSPKSPSKKSQFVSGISARASWNKNNSNTVIKEAKTTLHGIGQIEIKEHPLEAETKAKSPPTVAKKPKIKRNLSSKENDSPGMNPRSTTETLPIKTEANEKTVASSEECKNEVVEEAPSDGPAWVSLARRRSKKWESSITTTQSVAIAEPRTEEKMAQSANSKAKPTEAEDLTASKKSSSAQKTNRNVPKVSSNSMEESRPPLAKLASVRSVSSDNNAQGKVQGTQASGFSRGLPTVDPIKSSPPPWLAIAMEKQKRWVDGTV